MKFALQSTVLAALFFTVVFATPMKGRPAAPVAAQHKLPPDTITCGTNTYSRTDIQAAISNGHALVNTPIGMGRKKSRKYPHEFGNHEGLTMRPGCTGTPYYEFPILTHVVYNGEDPETDRVVFDPNGNYCAVMTHTGAAKGGFVSCVEPKSSTATPSSI